MSGLLDWRRHRLCRLPGSCRLCGRPAWLRDENGYCCHKVCAERARNRTAQAVAALDTGRLDDAPREP